MKAPQFDPHAFSVEWKSLPASLMYEILDFPYQTELASKNVSAAFEYAATPPDFSEGFEERQLQYASLGLAALKLAQKLRDYANLPPRDVSEWNPSEYMENHKIDIESRRNTRAGQYIMTDV